MSGAPWVSVFFRYQVFCESTTPMLVSPSPFQSPTTGTEPTGPYWMTESGAPCVFWFFKYQVAVAGSKTPRVLVPSPFQSPHTGIQCGAPYWIGDTDGAPESMELRKYQVA